MFGRDKHDDAAEEDNTVPVSVIPSSTPDPAPTPGPQDELRLPAPTDDVVTSASSNDPDEAADTAPVSTDFISSPDEPSEHEYTPDTASETHETPDEPVPDAELSASAPDTMPVSLSTPSDLSSLKQDALRELSPLIDHLDQSAEEKYDMAKMMYEETKDRAMLGKVYEAAKSLPDEKAKAVAILDVIKKIDEAN